jgi:hypothetical protein
MTHLFEAVSYTISVKSYGVSGESIYMAAFRGVLVGVWMLVTAKSGFPFE